MGMTITEKIIAQKAGRDHVVPGEIVMCQVDLACVDDVQFGIFRKAFEAIADTPWDSSKAMLIVDHYLPPSGVDQAEAVRALREFGFHHGLRNLFLHEGIKHQVFISQGLVVPGMLVAATDSHTNTTGALGALAIALGPTDMAAIWKEGRIWLKVPETIRFELEGEPGPAVSAKDIALHLLGRFGIGIGRYKAIEWTGRVIGRLGLDDRLTLCNLTTEMGAKNGIIQPDGRVIEYAKKTGRPFQTFGSDLDAQYAAVHRVDVSSVEPMVSVPFSPANAQRVSDVRGVKINQAFIGTCTNGRFDDLVTAAKILKGRKVNPEVRLLVIPAAMDVFREAWKQGVMDIFLQAGAIICNPNCGPCAGLHQGTLAAGEVMISSGPRNFHGRGGHPDSKLYIASPATVASSAVAGEIADPREYGEIL